MATVGTDIDGILCSELSKWQRFLTLNFPYKFLFFLFRFYKRAKIKNVYIDFIITGRPECDRRWTEKWLSKNGITYNKLYMAPTPSTKDYNVKTYWINSLGITDFVEDNVYTRFKLKEKTEATIHSNIKDIFKIRG